MIWLQSSWRLAPTINAPPHHDEFVFVNRAGRTSMSTSFSAVTARVCAATGKTVIKTAHSGAAAARPQLSAAVEAPSTHLPFPAHRFLKASSAEA